MNVRLLLVITAGLAAAGCNSAQQNKDAVKQGVVEHLKKNTGLDVAQMDIDISQVSFRDNEAQATVSFRPKGAPGDGLQMSYTLEKQGSQWVVKRRPQGASSPHGDAAPAPSGQLPQGHPPVQAPPAPAPAK